MGALAWWAIPIGATLVAVLWASWVGRPRGPGNVHDTVRHHERFKAALSRDVRVDECKPRRPAVTGRLGGVARVGAGLRTRRSV